MNFSAFKFCRNIRVCCQKRIEQCELFCCFSKQASFCFELSHFVLILKQKTTKNEISFFFPLTIAKSTVFFSSQMFPFSSRAKPFHSFAINKKKTTQTFIHHFFFQNNKFCFEFGQNKFDPQMEC